MSRYTQKNDDQQEPGQPATGRQPAVSRRVMLIGSGGLMLAIASLTGCSSDGLLAGALDPTPSATRRAAAAATRKPHHATTTQVTGAKTAPHPSSHPTHHDTPHPHDTSHPHQHPHATEGPPPPQPVYYVDDGPKVIALTIDDGPSPIYTPQILQILEKYHVKASFSMVGENVTYYPSVARDVADAGHLIVNHTWDHADLTRLTEAQTRAEIANASDAIHHAVGKTPTIFRAPYGAWSRTTLEYCKSENLMPLDWSVDPRDWARPGVSAIVRNILTTTETGSIILEHDGGGNRAETVAALKIAIPRLLDKGYRFATV